MMIANTAQPAKTIIASVVPSPPSGLKPSNCSIQSICLSPWLACASIGLDEERGQQQLCSALPPDTHKQGKVHVAPSTITLRLQKTPAPDCEVNHTRRPIFVPMLPSRRLDATVGGTQPGRPLYLAGPPIATADKSPH